MPVLEHIGALARCAPNAPQSDACVIESAALVWEGETIRWVGAESDLPVEYAGLPHEDAGGRLVIPGLVDCHTHLAFGGWRAEEFAQRLLGRTYLEIAAAGGGIASTVAKTRAATSEELVARCRDHLAGMARLGVTTVEAKTGYGLNTEHELRLLEIYRELAEGPQRLVATLLAAHVECVGCGFQMRSR
jgi:imidazolonepropionase